MGCTAPSDKKSFRTHFLFSLQLKRLTLEQIIERTKGCQNLKLQFRNMQLFGHQFSIKILQSPNVRGVFWHVCSYQSFPILYFVELHRYTRNRLFLIVKISIGNQIISELSIMQIPVQSRLMCAEFFR